MPRKNDPASRALLTNDKTSLSPDEDFPQPLELAVAENPPALRPPLGASSLAILSALTVPGAERVPGAAPMVPDNAFPACIQFSPVPSGKGWKGGKPPLSAEVRQDTLRNLIDHGFSVLYYPLGGLSEHKTRRSWPRPRRWA